ncbi:unnamed protein product [Toxocara canis]|uniref:Histone acetyltransferase n=1 Tax=Toxocara canis TaxID=6265 RepID=A0A183V0G9_TOXCA|nr:unnamed protein product [Toxocara canis]
MKQHAEQQAKSREMNNTVMHPLLNANAQTPLIPHAYNRFAPAPGASIAPISSTPISALNRPHNRKRQFEQIQSWQQQSSMCSPMGGMPPGAHMQRAYSMPHVLTELTSSVEMISQQPQRNVVFPDSSINLPCQNLNVSVSSSPSVSSLQGVTLDRSSSANDMKPVMGGCSSESLPPSTITSPASIDEMHNEAVIPELAESQMKNLMDQFGPGNPLSDLGDGCLDGVLAGHAEHGEQPSTSTQNVPSEITHSPHSHSIASVNSNSVVSPTSVGGGTPNGVTGPASVPPAAVHASGMSNSACNARAEPPTSANSLSNGIICVTLETFGGTSLGAPLGSSTPSTSSGSCCFSQMPSTSTFPPSCTPPMQRRPRIPYPGACHSDMMRNQQYDPRQQQHQMMMNQPARMSPAHQRFMYPCMSVGDQQLSDSNALLRMRQSVDDLAASVEKRAAFAPRFAPSNIDHTNIQMKQELSSGQPFIADSTRITYPQAVRQMHHVAMPSQHMFAAYSMHPQQPNIQRQVWYQMNGQMVSQQQHFGQQYYPSRNIYNYRYC